MGHVLDDVGETGRLHADPWRKISARAMVMPAIGGNRRAAATMLTIVPSGQTSSP